MTARPESVSIRELLAFYYKYRLRLALAFFVPVAAAVILSFIPTPRYQANSVLIVRMGSEYVYQPEVGANRSGPQATIPFDRDQIFKSEVAILKSASLHEEAIKLVGLERIYPDIAHPTAFLSIARGAFALGAEAGAAPLAKAVAQFGRRFDVRLEKDSAVINLAFEHPDAAVAAETLNALLKLYMEKRKQLYQESRVDFAASELETIHEKAIEAGQAVENFKRRNKIYSLAEQRAALLSARSEADRAQATIISPALEEKVAYYNRQLDRLDAMEREYNRLQHDRQIAEDEYALASHKLNEARAFENLERERAGSVRIIQPPTVPAEPNNLQMKIILAGLVLALFSLLGTAALTEYLDSAFVTPEKLERGLGVPVLGVISLRR